VPDHRPESESTSQSSSQSTSESTSESSAVDWAVLGTAPDQLTAELWRGLLDEQGIPAMLAPGDAVSFLGVSSTPCRLLVDERRVEEARTGIEAVFGPLDALNAPDAPDALDADDPAP
jgi:hypothetical protein